MSIATVVKERPILFSGPMVKALLAGQKTQTRRTIKKVTCVNGQDCITDRDGLPSHLSCAPHNWEQCPYGVPGDRLWVRETYRSTVAGKRGWAVIQYRADMEARQMLCTDEGEGEPAAVGEVIPKSSTIVETAWKPSIFMPHWASRITLEITDVRVQRLREISPEDAVAEGLRVRTDIAGKYSALPDRWFDDPVHTFADLWESINGEGSWVTNPWVWAITFRIV